MKDIKKYQGGGQIDSQSQPVDLSTVDLSAPLSAAEFNNSDLSNTIEGDIPLEYSPESWNIGDVDSTSYNNKIGGDDVNTELQKIDIDLARVGKVKNINGEFEDFRDGDYDNGEFDNASWYDKLT